MEKKTSEAKHYIEVAESAWDNKNYVQFLISLIPAKRTNAGKTL